MHELLQPLIGLGFADDLEQIEKMIAMVDEDDSNQIEFNEFLTIIKNSDGNESTSAIKKFFSDLNAGVYGDRKVSFSLLVLQMQRKNIVDAITTKDQARRDHTRRIMDNIKMHMEKTQEAKLNTNRSSKKSTIIN